MHLDKLSGFFWMAIKKIHSSFVSIGPNNDDDDDDELVIALHSL